jgi:hypothetical protein
MFEAADEIVILSRRRIVGRVETASAEADLADILARYEG